MPRHLEGRDHEDDPRTERGKHGPGWSGAGDSNGLPDADGLPGAPAPTAPPAAAVLRVQTGVRMEKRLVKVLKALAELYDRSLGDLLESIVLHAFAGRSPFSAESLRRIAELERIYGLDLDSRSGGQRALEPIE
jgi:hypothetical protein